MSNTPSWKDLGLSDSLIEILEKVGFKTPTLVQTEAIPAFLNGQDLQVSSQTGSGKTGSFVLPSVEIFKGKEGTYILALAPTREIAQQTQAVFETFGAPLGLRSVALIGGVDMRIDEAALKTYPQIIVATPGRLCDHLDRGNVWLDYIQVFILDEADRMLDMGFSSQINRIVEDLPAERQTVLFSATFPNSVTQLAKKILHNPKTITIGNVSQAAPLIEQHLVWLKEEDKMRALLQWLDQKPGPIMIFTASKDRASRVWEELHRRGVYDAVYIHSDRSQAQREQILADFKANKYRILIATDIAGRGVDVDDVTLVVNFDLTREAEDYIHRIGRTGRRGKTGIAVTLATYKDQEVIQDIEKLIRQKMEVHGNPPDPNRVSSRPSFKGRPGPGDRPGSSQRPRGYRPSGRTAGSGSNFGSGPRPTGQGPRPSSSGNRPRPPKK